MILVLAGTSEGRQTARLLRDSGFRVIVSVVSGSAASLQQIGGEGIEIMEGGLDRERLYNRLRERKISTIVDATHPYALRISKLAMEVADLSDLEYVRLEREGCRLPPSPLVNWFNDITQIEKFLTRGLNVFSTMGSKNLPLLMPIIRRTGAKLTVRVLPIAESLEVCTRVGVDPGNIVALKGPFPKDLNRSLFRYFRADLVLTKESGSRGGFDEKVAAAVELAIPILVQRRPILNYPLVVNSPGEAVDYLNRRRTIRKGRF